MILNFAFLNYDYLIIWKQSKFLLLFPFSLLFGHKKLALNYCIFTKIDNKIFKNSYPVLESGNLKRNLIKYILHEFWDNENLSKKTCQIIKLFRGKVCISFYKSMDFSLFCHQQMASTADWGQITMMYIGTYV